MVAAMHKPPPRATIAIMLGAPSRFAEESKPGRDEDNLDREEDDSGHFDDGPTNTLDLLYERLRLGDEVAAHAGMSLARCIQEMCHQAARRNKAGLRHWYEQCCDLIAHIDGDGEERDE